MADLQTWGIIGGTGFGLVACTVFFLNFTNRNGKLATDGLSPDQAGNLDREVNDWLNRRKNQGG